MKRMMTTVLLLLTAAFIINASTSSAEELTAEALAQMEQYYRYFSVLDATDEAPLRYVYGDDGMIVHVYSVKDGRQVLEWEVNVGSSIRALIVRTVAEGDTRIIIATSRGKVFVYDANTYRLIMENLMEPFVTILCFNLANVDDDPQIEVILVGTRTHTSASHLYVYDSVSKVLQWQSAKPCAATELLIASIDDDVQEEIILNSGKIFDSRFHTLETFGVGEGGFGTRMRLLDLTGDGIPEIIGEAAGEALMVYDPYAQRKLN